MAKHFSFKGCGPLYGENITQIGVRFVEFHIFHGSQRYSSQSCCMLGLTSPFRLKPVQITFPRFDPDGIAKGDLSSTTMAVSIDKYVSQDLRLLAPDAVELLDRFLPILIKGLRSSSFCSTILTRTHTFGGILSFFPCVPKD